MSITDRIYSVLIVSASKNFTDAVRSTLSSARFEPLTVVGSVNAARRASAEQAYDLVLINSPLPDETGTRFAIDLCSAKGTVVLLLVSSEIHEEIFTETASYGVFTLARPLSRSTFAIAMNWLLSARERLRRTEKKVFSIEEKMEEIRLVNRAKWILITELKMDEPAAHRYIEKLSMDRCISKGDVARSILRTYLAK